MDNLTNLNLINGIKIIEDKLIETNLILDCTKFECQNQALESLDIEFQVLEF